MKRLPLPSDRILRAAAESTARIVAAACPEPKHAVEALQLEERLARAVLDALHTELRRARYTPAGLDDAERRARLDKMDLIDAYQSRAWAFTALDPDCDGWIDGFDGRGRAVRLNVAGSPAMRGLVARQGPATPRGGRRRRRKCAEPWQCE